MHRAARNTTTRPLVIDDDGHTLGGGEWGVVDDRHDEVKVGFATGDLRQAPADLGDSAVDEALAAVRAAEEANGKTRKRSSTTSGGNRDADKTEES